MIKICQIFYDTNLGIIFNSDINKHDAFQSRSKFGSLLFDDLVLFDYIDQTQVNFIDSFSKVDGDTIVVVNQNYNLTDEVWEKILNLNPKKFIFDYASHDCTNRWLEVIELIDKLKGRDFKIITKSIDFDEDDNLLYYDQQLSRMIFWMYPNIKFNSESDYKKFKLLPDSTAISSFHSLKTIMKQDNLLPIKKGIFFVGHPRYHKIELLNHIYKSGYLDDIWWASSDIDYDLGNDMNWGGENPIIENSTDYNNFEVLKLLPKKLDYGYESSKHHLVSIGITLNWPIYLDSCFDIVGETDFVLGDNSVHHISEKTIKPILLGLPFILLNSHNTISKLENNFEFEFERGESLFSVDYDNIENGRSRMESIKERVIKIFEMDSKYLKDYSYDYIKRYEKNLNILLKVFWRQSVKKIGDYINE